MRSWKYLTLSMALASLIACTVNPVTGDHELSLTSADEELNIGRSQYLPTQQSQGGQYYLDPELTFYVQQVGNKLAAVSDRSKLPFEFVILNNSVPNAWALPGGKIAINRGLLLELDDEAQLAAVLSHEIVHAAARHSAQQMDRSMVIGIGVAAAGIALSDHEQANMILGSAALGANLVNSKYGRSAELESDHYGMIYMSKLGYDLNGAIELQKTFVRLSSGQQSDFISGLFASHPPSQERVSENLKTAADLPPGNIRNREIYQRHIAKLKRDLPAYQAYDKGLAALAKGNSQSALNFANTAIKKQPEESLFYELQGMAYESSKNKKSALKSFDKSISLNNHYYSHYLNRGLLRKSMGDSHGANSDLKRSNELLPTAAANNNLGKLALAAGNSNSARNYFNSSANAGGESGAEAKRYLMKIDLKTNPDSWLPSDVRANQQGELFVIIGNRGNVAVKNIRINIQQYKNGKLTSIKKVTVNLNPGQQKNIALNKKITNINQLENYRSNVISAELK
ncbi:Beta-barrel assembly-enhancing protease [Sinobacterium norvegicum]|uniref:Beta-barrel assembly-enhancing protease n=1 Tax=Sinobacterium norvegicum TaxID=1641715 RepID=A0ABM9AIX7_9GAMM|nr:M48 family metalloprotease [Sinobacterium norvegicum]CAH0993118.1 Beta-barrel assembly-enhancing protease [Sinobacterium norvegicum]